MKRTKLNIETHHYIFKQCNTNGSAVVPNVSTSAIQSQAAGHVPRTNSTVPIFSTTAQPPMWFCSHTTVLQASFILIQQLVLAKQFDWLTDIKNVTIFHHNIMVSLLGMYYSASTLTCCHGNILIYNSNQQLHCNFKSFIRCQSREIMTVSGHQ